MDIKYDPNAWFADRDYVNQNFAKKCEAGPKGFSNDLWALRDFLKDKPFGPAAALILFALGYFVWPIDASPDIIPVAGYADDVAVVAAVITQLGSALDPYR